MKRSRVTVRLTALAAGFLIGQAFIQVSVGPALAADAARGKILFTQKYGCFECHGTQGQGSPVTGPRLAPNPLPYDTIAAFIRTSNGPMPPFRESILPNADLQDIYAYLQSIPPAPDYKTIPLLSGK
ncbi:MAG TPA: cytochrome c [Xanthobacteraceae bacterium]|jgi:mono/diheme cytochrome c family protein|nr:cytochrome c [Xanthobacteraceae bacterium]